MWNLQRYCTINFEAKEKWEKNKNRKDYQEFTKSLSMQLETNGATREAYTFEWHLCPQSLPCATMFTDSTDCMCFAWNSLLPCSEKSLGLLYFDLKMTFNYGYFCFGNNCQYFPLRGKEGKDNLSHPKKKLWPSHYINAKAFHPKVVYLKINKTVIIRTISVSL